VLVSDTAHGPVIDAVSGMAMAAGAQSGMRLADARMLAPELVAIPFDHEGNQRTLGKLALATQRWGPWSMVDGYDGILLDSSGSAHLFGGDGPMLTRIETFFLRQGYQCRIACAPSSGAAWALSHYAENRSAIAMPDDLPEALAPLPVAALRLNSETRLLLARLGLKTVGDLMEVPRESLVRRFRNRRFRRSQSPGQARSGAGA
jgi:protein ImuB